MRKRICIVSGSRADYGPLRPLLHLFKKDKHIKLQLVVTGSHLSPQFGLTYEGDQLGQGKENSRNFLIDNPDLANEIETKIRDHYVPVVIDPELVAAIDEATSEVDF